MKVLITIEVECDPDGSVTPVYIREEMEHKAAKFANRAFKPGPSRIGANITGWEVNASRTDYQ